MLKRFKLGSVFGIPLEVDVTLLVVLPVIAWAVATDITAVAEILRPVMGVGLDAGAITAGRWPWILGALAALGLFCSVTLHELGHSVVAIRRGYEVAGIQLWLLGGISRFADQPDEWRDELAIALAGPTVSVMLGVGGLVLLSVLPASVPRIQLLVGYLGVMNIMLAVFNMIPGFPMDGGRVLRAILSRNRPLPDATERAATVGKAVAVCMGVLAILSFNLLLGGVAAFVYIGASAEASQTRLQSTFEGTTVADLMTPAEDVETVEPDETVAALLDRMYSERHTGYPVIEDGTVGGIVTLEDVSAVDGSRADATQVETVMSSDLVTVEPTTPAFDALERMTEAGVGRLVVTDESEEIVGLISRSDLMTAVSIARQRPQIDRSPAAGSRATLIDG